MPLISSLASIQKDMAGQAESFLRAGRPPSLREGLLWSLPWRHWQGLPDVMLVTL